MNDPSIHIEERGDVAVVRLAGDIDLANASDVGRALTRASSSSSGLVIDLTSVTYLDSAGIGELFTLAARLGPGGGLAVVVPTGSPLRRLLKITNFDEAAPVCLTDEDAITALTTRS